MEVRTFPSGHTSIRIHFSYKGVECRETLKGMKVNAENVKYARDLKTEIQSAITKGTFRYSKYFPQSKRGRVLDGGPSHATLKDIRPEYETEIKGKYQHSTVRAYTQPLNAWVIPVFGKYPMAELSPAQIRREIKHLAKRGLKPKSIGVYKTALNRILDFAVEEEFIPVNPALSVSVGRTIGQQPKGDKVDPFTRDEIKTIIETASDACGGQYARYLAFAFYTGLRTSELYGLKWEDVSLRKGRVFIHQAIVQGKYKAMPKTDAGIRKVFLLPPALDALKEQQKSTRFRKHGHVWENPRLHKPFRRYKETAGRWKRVLVKAGIRYRNPYQTRHTYASHLLSDGERPYFVSSQLGHKTVEVVMRHYGRWVKQEEHSWISDFGREKG